MQCFPPDMSALAVSFSEAKEILAMLSCKLTILFFLFAGFIVALIFTYNYFNSDYYYWAPSLCIVILAILLVLIIYECGRIHCAKRIVSGMQNFSKDTAKKIADYYESLEEINRNFDFKEVPKDNTI